MAGESGSDGSKLRHAQRNMYLFLVPSCVVSFLLWMPYGFGYADFPRENGFVVALLLAFVLAFPLIALKSLITSRSLIGQGFSVFSLFVGLHGLFHMLDWWVKMLRR